MPTPVFALQSETSYGKEAHYDIAQISWMKLMRTHVMATDEMQLSASQPCFSSKNGG